MTSVIKTNHTSITFKLCMSMACQMLMQLSMIIIMIMAIVGHYTNKIFFFVIIDRVDFILTVFYKLGHNAFFLIQAFKTDPVAHRPRLCKFGGAHMAHKAKDRVTNQEFPSCHS